MAPENTPASTKVNGHPEDVLFQKRMIRQKKGAVPNAKTRKGQLAKGGPSDSSGGCNGLLGAPKDAWDQERGLRKTKYRHSGRKKKKEERVQL